MSRVYYSNLINPNLAYNSGTTNVTNPLTQDLDAGENSVVNLRAPVGSGDAVPLGYFNTHVPSGGLENPLTENLDMGDFRIINLADPSGNNDAVNLQYLNSVLPSAGVTNPLTEELNADGQSIINVNMLYFQNENDAATGVGLQSNYGTVSMDGNLQLGNFSIGANTAQFLNLHVSESNDPSNNMYQVMIYGGQLYTQQLNAGNGKWYLYQSNCDLANNPVKNVQYVSFNGAGTLDCDLQDNLTYNSDIVVTAANVQNYVDQHDWTPTAASDLNMADYSVVNAKSFQFNGASQAVLNVDTSDNLVYNNELIVARQQDIISSEARQFTEYIPGQSVAMNGNPIGGNTTESVDFGSSIYYDVPVRYNFTFNFTTYNNTVIPLDEDLWITVGFCDNQNEANSDIKIDYVKIDGRLITLQNNVYSCNVNVVDPSTAVNGLTFINTMGAVLVAFENAPTLDAYYYIKINGEVSGTATYLATFSGSVEVPTGGYDNDFYLSIPKASLNTCMVPINHQSGNYALPIIQYAADVAQSNGVNNLLTITPPTVTGDNGMGFSITATVISAWYYVKYTAVIYSNNGDVEIANGSDSILHMWNPNNVLIAPTFFIDASNNIVVQNQIATSVQHAINTASVKAKLMIVNY
jgi:hypothetical protein